LSFDSVQTNTTKDLTLAVQNVGSGILAGNAGVGSPFSVISGATYSLSAGQSQVVTIRYSPTSIGTNNQSATFTGGGGATCAVSGVGVGAQPPTVGVNPTTLDFGTVLLGSTADKTFTLQNTGGGTLSGNASVAAPFSVVSGAAYNLNAGQTQVVTIRFTPTVAGASSQTVNLPGGTGGNITVTGSGLAPRPPGSLTFQASDGTITSPFVLSNGAISQSALSGVTDGGRAVYSFNLTNSGFFVIQALVNAPGLTSNSFYVNFDAEPQDPSMASDILPPTSGFEQRFLSWRGNGTGDSDQFGTNKFSLAAGNHQLIIRGREAGTALQSLSILKVPDAPTNFRVVIGP